MSDILKTQKSFARKAEAVPEHQFQDLYHLVCRWDWLETALQQVLSNKGARTAGVDGMTKEDLKTPEQQHDFLVELQQELKEGTYQPLPVDQVWIPKAKIKHLLRRQTALMPADLKFQQLNRVIRGWGYYYHLVNFTTTAKKLDWWLNERVLIWLKEKHKGVGVRRILKQYKIREVQGHRDRYNFASISDKGKTVTITLLSDIPVKKYYFKKRPNPYLETEEILQHPEIETPFKQVHDIRFDGSDARWQKQRRRALHRDKYQCRKCEQTWDEIPLHVHHLISKLDGGRDDLDNLITLCEDCHISTDTFGKQPKG